MQAPPSNMQDAGARRRVLMVAFQFPPLAGTSGVQRTLRFVQHLPSLGWQPIVLSAHPRAYVETSQDLLAEVPPGTVVTRAFSLDTARHLAIAGRYPGFLARPDRWSTWALGAVPAGLRLIRKYRPDVIWSTYPIATAHLIAQRLHDLTGIPLVADFRDPMTHVGYPPDPATWKAFRDIEARTVRSASRVVMVTQSAQALYQDRYPDVPPSRFSIVENGYDEEAFVAAESVLDRSALTPGRFTILHSGIVYPSERDPRALFAALGRMRGQGRIDATRLRLRFRAPVHGDLLRQLAQESGTSDLLEILPPVSYGEALQEMLRADGLLVMQGANCNEQVPAKLYEYFRARRPILGLADPGGDTGKVMMQAGVAHVAPLEDSHQVQAAFERYLAEAPLASVAAPRGMVESMSRRARAQALAQVFAEESLAVAASTPSAKLRC